jgi:hypothetical protein
MRSKATRPGLGRTARCERGRARSSAALGAAAPGPVKGVELEAVVVFHRATAPSDARHRLGPRPPRDETKPSPMQGLALTRATMMASRPALGRALTLATSVGVTPNARRALTLATRMVATPDAQLMLATRVRALPMLATKASKSSVSGREGRGRGVAAESLASRMTGQAAPPRRPFTRPRTQSGRWNTRVGAAAPPLVPYTSARQETPADRTGVSSPVERKRGNAQRPIWPD